MSNRDDVYSERGMVIIRQSFLDLVDGNACAASLLDRFNAQATTDWEFRGYESHLGKEFDPRIRFSINGLVERQCRLFTQEEIVNGLNLLIEKSYIVGVDPDGMGYAFMFDRDKLHRELHPSFYQQVDTEEILQLQQEDLPEEEEEPQPTNRNEAKRVKYHNKRASRVGLPATLTIEQWRSILEYYNWHCAFCGIGSYEVLEHFIPLIQGGGTTEYNCVPSCARCNGIKHDEHPSMIPASSPLFAAIQSVEQYLERRREETMA